LIALEDFRGDGEDLLRRLARAVNDFWEILAQRALEIHLSEAEVCYRRSLKCAQGVVHGRFTSPHALQKFFRFVAVTAQASAVSTEFGISKFWKEQARLRTGKIRKQLEFVFVSSVFGNHRLLSLIDD
jgi:hypothetical protein